jgi:hypothetical protein
MTARPESTAPTILAEGVRARTITWTDPARVRFRLRGQDGLAQLRAIMRGEAGAPPAAAPLGLRLAEVERGRVVHLGGRIATTEARVVDDTGTRYAHATSTLLVMRRGGAR